MGLNIGRLLYGIRTKYEMNVKDICRGICSPSSYCMYENGEIVPDILLVNMFLDRMGFGILGLTAYISEKEVVYFKWKESTRACIRNENYKKLGMLLERIPTGNVSLNKKIREQYAWFIKGIVAEKDTADLKKATECYEKALECTCGFLIKSQKIEGTFSVREIHIYAIYLNLLCKVNPKEKEEVISRFYQLMQYVNVHYVEEQQKVKIYPLLVCLWGNLVIEGKDTEGSFEIFEKTLELLRKQKSLYCLLEIMRLHILAGLKEKRDMSKEQEDIRILQSFFDELFNKKSDVDLLKYIVSEFKYFDDSSIYKGKRIKFNKRATLLVNDLYYMSSTIHNNLKNVDNLTGCADYGIPRTLRTYGILEYNEELSNIIDSEIELKHDSNMEIEIRANMLYVLELIREKLESKGIKINSVELDNVIWQMGTKKKNVNPYHHTITIFY